MNILTHRKIIANDYCTRAKILNNIPIFNKKIQTRNITSLNTNCNAAHLAEYLFQNIPSCTTAYNCDNCGHNYKRLSPICNINVNVIIENGLNNMQQAINDDTIARKETTCNNCKKRINRTILYASHLIIDSSILSDPNYTQAQNTEKHNFILDNITKLVVFDNAEYILSSIFFRLHLKQNRNKLV